MKTIIAGSRDCTDMDILMDAIKDIDWHITAVVSGTARGADRLGERYAISRDLLIELYPADWDTHGKSAGYIRNKEMADNADALIALWDGKSRGTKHMIDLAEKKGIRVHVHRY